MRKPRWTVAVQWTLEAFQPVAYGIYHDKDIATMQADRWQTAADKVDDNVRIEVVQVFERGQFTGHLRSHEARINTSAMLDGKSS
jgi:hypothetical protein